MEEIFKPMKKVKLIDSIEHQGIGGQEILIERKMSLDDAPKNIALFNYLDRRFNVNKLLPDTLYYGHVNKLGYFVSEDEFDGELMDATQDDYMKIW